ncbi:glycoside hydrolase [Phaeosphaeriaceae sp. SRC1lsM3a]|nr:glycoside hydrolase [Stagonospora sp. SRC1lsM3a]
MHFSNIIAGLALLSSAAAPSGPPKPPAGGEGPGKNQTLYQAMKKAGRSYIGTAVTLRNETREVDVIRTEFNSMTPENAMKWESTEPSRGNFTFADGDRHAQFAKDNGLQLRCHTLVWHSQLPTWVSQGGFDNATLIQVMEDHIKALGSRWNDYCGQWDVVNEALNEDGTYRSSVFYNTIGEAFIPIAFRLAKKYAPKALLFYNDYNIEDNGPKTAGAVRIVKLIQSYGVHIDGVGYQGHLTSEPTNSNPGSAPDQATLEAALRATADLGVNVAYTELDVRLNTTTLSTESIAKQTAVWTNVAKACLSVEKCIGMTVWGVSDKYSWIPGVFPGEGEGLLFDDEYNKKNAYYGFLAGIESS